MNKVKMIRAIRIDVLNKNIEDVTINEKDFLNECHKHIDCNMIEIAVQFPKDVLWVDEEGLCKKPVGYFTIVGGHQPFAGNGLIVGYNAKKDKNIDSSLTAAGLKQLVRFL